MKFPEPGDLGNGEEPDVPEVFREFIEKGSVFPGYAEAAPEDESGFLVDGKVIAIITDILMDVKVNIEHDKYRFFQKVRLPSGQSAYFVRETKLFELLSKTAARVWWASSIPEKGEDDLPFD